MGHFGLPGALLGGGLLGGVLGGVLGGGSARGGGGLGDLVRDPEILGPKKVTDFSKISRFFAIFKNLRNRVFLLGRSGFGGVLAESRPFFSVPRILGVKKKSFGLDHGRAFFQKMAA